MTSLTPVYSDNEEKEDLQPLTASSCEDMEDEIEANWQKAPTQTASDTGSTQQLQALATLSHRKVWLVNMCFFLVSLGLFIGSSTDSFTTSRGLDTPNPWQDSVVSSDSLQTPEVPPASQQELPLPSEKESILKEAGKKTSLPLPLQPPYRIAQLGVPRSGSTFQTHLLDAIVQLKTQGKYNVSFGYIDYPASRLREDQEKSFVRKTHKIKHDKLLGDVVHEGKVVVFSSGLSPDIDAFQYSLYNQNKINLESCPLCEVDNYKYLFGLTDDEVNRLKNYMRLYTAIRQCCGLQMSRFQMARLNGCDVTPFVNDPGYPHCDLYNMSEVEQEIASLDWMEHRVDTPNLNWAKPGDCAKFDAVVSGGVGFNGASYTKQNCP